MLSLALSQKQTLRIKKMHQPTTFQKENLPHEKPIDLKKIKPRITEILDRNQATLKTLLAQKEPFTWDNLMQPIEEMNDELSKAWSPIGHMHAVMETEELRKIYNEMLPILTEYHTAISQNEALYQAVLKIYNSKDFATLTPAQRKIIENDIRDFKLAGIHLPPAEKKRFSILQKELSLANDNFC